MRRAVALVFVLSVACGNSRRSPSPTVAPQTPAAESGAAPREARLDAGPGADGGPAADEAPPPPVVTLLDAGDAPRAPFRYVWTKATESFALDLKASNSVKQGSLDAPVTTRPTRRLGVVVRPTNVGQDDALSATLEVTSAEVLGDGALSREASQAHATDAQRFVGLKMVLVVSARGVLESSELVPGPAGLPRAAEDLHAVADVLRNLSAPVPEQAFGKRARWTVTARVKPTLSSVRTLSSMRTTTFTVKDRSPNRLVLDATIAETAPRQARTGPEVPIGSTITIESAEGGGSGHQTVAPARLSPTAWTRMLELKTVSTVKTTATTFSLITHDAVDTELRPSR